MPFKSDIPKAGSLYYLVVYPIFYGLALLPFSILYLISDGLYLILYRIIGYRKMVVRKNLGNAFPHKSLEERRELERQYYKHLSDLFVEIIKALRISPEELKKRMHYENVEIFHELNKKKQSAVVVLTHSGNWEWIALASKLYVEQNVLITYKTLSNPNFDYLMYRMRSRFLGTPVHMTETLRAVSTLNAQNDPFIVALIGDQSPSNLNGVHWQNFLNQDTAFLNGPAKIAKKYKLPVVYLQQEKVKRGYYRARFTINMDSNQLTNEEIMASCIQSMEKEIEKQPFTWLWSHRRWKHKNKSNSI